MFKSHEIDGLTPPRLAAVLAVAATGSFSAAAREVGTSQSAVSRAVSVVESILGGAIFDRSTRSVRLTEQGREFVERAALVHAELQAAVRACRPDDRRAPRLVIAALTSVSELYLAKALASIGRRPPRFGCIEGLQSAVEHAVVSGHAAAGLGDLADVPADLTTRPLWTEPFLVAVRRGHRLGRRRTVALEDLASERLVGFSRGAELRTALDRELASTRQLRAPDIVVDRYRTALSMVAAGLGVMVVPAIASAGVPAGAKLVDLDHPGFRRTMGVLYRPGGRSEPLNALVDRLVDAVSETPGVVVAGQ